MLNTIDELEDSINFSPMPLPKKKNIFENNDSKKVVNPEKKNSLDCIEEKDNEGEQSNDNN
jgi:hypothetical protein